MILQDLLTHLEQLAPLALAESWDNVGLLLGDPSSKISKVITCLTLTPDVAQEAIETRADLVITHHPILFKPVNRLTTQTSEGAMLLALAKANVAVYSAHTAFDSAWDGINQQLISRLGVLTSRPLKELVANPKQTSHAHIDEAFIRPVGIGRVGELPTEKTLGDVLSQLNAEFPNTTIGYVGDPSRTVKTIGVGCGSAAQFMDLAEVDLFITGEARFHDCLKARSQNIGLVLLGHYTSERFAMEQLAEQLGNRFSDLTCWPSRIESDPLQWI